MARDRRTATYPTAARDGWYGECDYAARGGRMVSADPAEYLAAVRPLALDETSRENIDDLKAHILGGGSLDPLLIREDGKEDGRHRARAALELGIAEVPVIVYGDHLAHLPTIGDETVPPAVRRM